LRFFVSFYFVVYVVFSCLMFFFLDLLFKLFDSFMMRF